MIKENEYYVYIDESGDPHLPVDKEGISQYYIITAIIVKGTELLKVNESIHVIKSKYFQNGEIKSSKIGNNRTRRQKILNSLVGISFKHYSQVVDKSEILTDSGLMFKKSFVKFINRTMYQRLFDVYPILHIIADEYGTSEFMKEFGRYITKRIPLSLFDHSSFKFGDSKNYVLIQLGDLIAGTIARVYSGTDPIDMLNIIRTNTIIIDEWPPKSPKPIIQYDSDKDKVDDIIRRQAVLMATKYIDKHSFEKDIFVQAQIAAVRYLLYYFRSVDPEKYIPTSMLHLHLSELGYKMSERILRSSVIGSLRDNSVFIVSNNNGIKIPYDCQELISFSSQVDNHVMPYLRRLKIIRNHFLLSTNGDFDMADKQLFPKMSEILEKCV